MDFSKMDFKKIIDINEIKKTLTRLENIAALSLVLFFFFPWASIGPFSVNGFGAASSGGKALIFFLIPILGLMVVAMRPICQVPNILKIVKLVAGGLPIVFFVIALLNGGGDVFKVMGMGVYLTLIASVLIILGTLDKVQLSNALPAVESCETDSETTKS